MRRFFYTPDQENSGTVRITGSEAHHMATVLRMQPGTPLELFDAKGGIAGGEILEISAREVTIQILSCSVTVDTSPPLTLVQAMLKGKKMDFLVQKATELGVHTFIPLITRYCEKKAMGKQQARRWQRIMLEACKQCRRPVPMEISEPLSLERLRPEPDSNLIMPWEDEHCRPLTPALLQTQLPTTLIIGPEGGFHPSEIEYVQQIGFITVSLGPRILRAETAAVGTVAILQNYSLQPSRDL